ncbi:GntR family transcriptional regulator [Silvibacterium acidisoli]|uniref:GntR family transcriptional regulator n=1 Tax=Acidobacteriaceae bacterium ZG23-2 TaxID=2883246 RepID=UPI00406C195D
MEGVVEPLYRKIRRDIVECELTPGKSFSEAELGRLYNAGRTPVREACRRLEREGLIRIIPFRGYMVTPLSVSEFKDLEEMQLIFEPEAAALATERATDEELEKILRLAHYEYRLDDKQSYREFVQKNYELHSLIAQCTRNRRLHEVIGNVHVRLMRFFYLGIPLDSYGQALAAEHLAMANAMRARNAGEARQHAETHIRNAMDRSSKLLMDAIRFGEAVFDTASVAGTIASPGRRSTKNTQ